MQTNVKMYFLLICGASGLVNMCITTVPLFDPKVQYSICFSSGNGANGKTSQCILMQVDSRIDTMVSVEKALL